MKDLFAQMAKQLVSDLRSSFGGAGQGRKFDPIARTEQWVEKLPAPLLLGLGGSRESARNRMLDVVLNFGIPFNRWLGLRIREFGVDCVEIESPPSALRRNHVGTAHACAQALIGEYAAGLVIAQNFQFDAYRMIIGRLEVDYHRPGRGTLVGRANAPEAWPELLEEEGWIDMQTEIRNEKAEVVSIVRSRWQLKSWKKIEAERAMRSVDRG